MVMSHFKGEWLGSIPNDWDQKKIKHIFNIKKNIAGTLGYDVISITQKGAKVKNIESGEGQLSMDYSKYQLVDQGDFLMNHMDLLTGFIDISKFNGVTSPDYRVFYLKDSNLCGQFFLYLFQYCYTSKIFYGYGRGSSKFGRWRLPSVEFLNLYVPIPNIKEQKLISRYLDKKIKQIDSLIKKIEKKIELLNEQKTVLINQYLQKGLDPNFDINDSKIVSIDKDPKDWSLKRIKYLFEEYFGGSWGDEPDTNNSDTLIKVIRVSEFDMKKLIIKEEIPTLRSLVIDKQSNKLVKKNDLILEKSGGGEKSPVGRVVLVEKDISSPTINSNFTNLCRPTSSINPRFLVYVLNNNYNKGITKKYIKQTTGIQNLDIYDYMSEKVLIPSIEKQILISKFLDRKTDQLNLIVEKLSQKIQLLLEYRQSLISSVVTGKIRVTEDMI